MSMPCKVSLLGAGIAEGSALHWSSSSYRVNRIHLPLSGRANYRDINGEKTLETGSVYLMINGFSQDLSLIPGMGYRHLYLDFQCTPPLFIGEILRIGTEDDGCLRSLVASAEMLIQSGVEGIDGEYIVPAKNDVFMELERLLSVILSYLQRNYGISVVKNEKIEAAIRFIRHHYSEPIRNSDIASALHIDNRYLIRLFRRYMSMPPYQYLTQYRVERAAECLRQGKSVTETAFACGYQSETAFRIAFKRIMGCCPSSLSKQY